MRCTPNLNRLSLLCAVAILILAVAGCDDATTEVPALDTASDTGSTGDDMASDVPSGDTPTDTPEGCQPTETVCGASCCGPTQTCSSGVCVDDSCPGVACGEVCCASGEVCDAGSCVATCASGLPACGGTCCASGELCDGAAGQCAAACSDDRARCNGQCCLPGAACESGQCRAQCDDPADRCGDRVESEVCCDAGQVCESGRCALDCTDGPRCGQGVTAVCCGAGEVCEAGACKAQCGGTRCGANDDLCCVGSEACLFDACIETYGPCADNFDCGLDEYCETGTGQCIKAADDPNQCIYVPEVMPFEPATQWHWSGSTLHPTYDQVMMTPTVINLTDDDGDGQITEADVPDVIFGTFAGSNYNGAGALRVVSGDDGRELAASIDLPFSVSRNMAAADIDKDGVPEIIASSCRACDPDTVYAMELQADGAGGYTLVETGRAEFSTSAANGGATASIADLEGDGTVEIVTEYGIIEGATMTVRCEASWSVPLVADLDGNGTSEIISGGRVFDQNCVQVLAGASGLAAVADLVPDSGVGDLTPELVFVRSATVTGTIELWNVTRQPTGEWAMEQLWATQIPMNAQRISDLYGGLVCTPSSTEKACNTGGGPPTIADFDGDGQPEISTAARWYYIVVETDGQILWADGTTRDYSSAATGSSVFDFEGDGQAEVVYNDELKLRVYKGTGSGVDGDGDGYADAEVLYEQDNPSGTLLEYPLIVDVDNDGNAEIVLAANNYAFAGVTGIRVFEDPLDNWVRTRRVWNQHAYHVTNIEEDGSVPSPERANWTVPGLNNYRQNVQPGGLFNAPNLVVDAVAPDESGCPSTRNIAVTVSNQGSLGVGPGVWIGVYAINLPAPDDRALLGHVQLTNKLAPGASETVSLVWDGSATLLPSGSPTTLTPPVEVEVIVDDPPAALGTNGDHNECVETDNTSSATLIEACEIA